MTESPRIIKAFTGAVLSLALVLASPGHECYAASSAVLSTPVSKTGAVATGKVGGPGNSLIQAAPGGLPLSPAGLTGVLKVTAGIPAIDEGIGTSPLALPAAVAAAPAAVPVRVATFAKDAAPAAAAPAEAPGISAQAVLAESVRCMEVRDEAGRREALDLVFTGSLVKADAADMPVTASPIPASASGPGPAVGLGPARTASSGRVGTVLPGLARPFSDYRAPLGLRLQLAASNTLHAVLMGLSVSVMLYALGPAFAAGVLAFAAIPAVFSRPSVRDRGTESVPESDIPGFPDSVRESADTLWRRLGLDPGGAPRAVRYYKGDSLRANVSVGREAGAKLINIGEGYARIPANQTLAVLAHEIGHWLLRDDRAFVFWTNSRVGQRVLTGVMAALPAGMLAGVVAFAAGLLSLSALLLLYASPFILITAMCFRFAALRQLEKRADHFSAWLTDPRWLADYFQTSAPNGEKRLSLPDRFLAWTVSDHPRREVRIRRLRALMMGDGSNARARR